MNDSEFDVPSSQETEEDPTLPGHPAGSATITLTPSNARARLAFWEVAEWLQEQSDDPIVRDAQQHAQKYMWISPTQQRDAEVASLVRRLHTGQLSSSPSSSHTSSHQSTEQDEPQVEIWNGVYFLSLDEQPGNPSRGWTIGCFKNGPNFNDLVLSPHAAKSKNNTNYEVRERQALLQISDTGLIYVRSLSSKAYSTLDGNRVHSDVRLLNQPSAELTFGSLRYRVDYTRNARSEGYTKRVHKYLKEVIGTQVSLSTLALTPTPAEKGVIKIGQWVLTGGTIGTGASGRVTIGTNDKAQCVALKRMSVVPSNKMFARQREERLKTITSLCQQHNESRLLQLVETISDDENSKNSTQDLWFVLTPVVAHTLDIMIAEGVLGQRDQRCAIATTVLVDILGATQFLHHNGWLHGDLKPKNVGIRTWTTDTKSITLLDLDDIQRSPPSGSLLPSDPGRTGGTIGWLSPEREMGGYNETADIWSIGVMALELIWGHHPWKARENPWRNDHTSNRAAELQKVFNVHYRGTVRELGRLSDRGLQQATLGMIRHESAEQHMPTQRQPRMTSKEVLDILLPTDKLLHKRHKAF